MGLLMFKLLGNSKKLAKAEALIGGENSIEEY
jgi:hypothetical protein